MDSRGRDGEHDPKEVTEVISRNIKAGHEKDYDDWLRRYMSLERKFQGYLGTTIIVPGGSNSSVRYVINRFADNASLDAWENSDEALKILEEANACSTQYYERATGMETWFILPDFKNMAVPPRWKMAIVAFIGAYCISSITRYILNLYLGPWPLLTSIVMNMILVVGLTYFAMPVLSRLLQRWLYPKTGMNYQR
jgi:antibiotic biosynthesis monooxygenase (ABM) superfamily enzyme